MGLLSVSEQLKVLGELGPKRVSPALAPTMTGDAASVQVSLILGAKGVNYSPSSACSSGSDAIGQAYELIRQSNAKVDSKRKILIIIIMIIVYFMEK